MKKFEIIIQFALYIAHLNMDNHPVLIGNIAGTYNN